MKMMIKCMIFISVLLLLSGMGLAGRYFLPHSELPALYQIGIHSTEWASQELKGCDRCMLISNWGDPDRCLFGMYGDTWVCGIGETITVYYDSDAKVINVQKGGMQ